MSFDLKNKTIAIIGVGYIGGILARKLSALGASVRVANSRGAASLQEKAAEWNVTAADTADVAKDADVVIVSIPFHKVPELPSDLLRHAKSDVVVVETNNYYPFRDGKIDAIEQGQTESAWNEQHLGHRVVKCFNAVSFVSLENQGKPKGDPARVALPLAGDDARDKQVVIDLLDAIGFDGVDGGSIADSWRFEPGQPAYCCDFNAAELRAALARAKDAATKHARRDAGVAKLMDGTQRSNAELIALIRSVNDAP